MTDHDWGKVGILGCSLVFSDLRVYSFIKLLVRLSRCSE